MADLRITGRDDAYLLLSDDLGGVHRLALDESLRTAVRRLPSDESSGLTPRQIQDRLRLGASAEAVAAAAGVSVERIQRWEVPVLAERAHALTRARATRYVRPPDGSLSGPLGRLVEQRLAALGLLAEWDAFRDPERGWVIRVSHDRGLAEWTYDGSALTARDANAESLGWREPPRAVDPVGERMRVVELDPPPGRREDEETQAAEDPPTEALPVRGRRKSGRTALPSWDSILDNSPPPNAFPT